MFHIGRDPESRMPAEWFLGRHFWAANGISSGFFIPRQRRERKRREENGRVESCRGGIGFGKFWGRVSPFVSQ
jgi:hypothetical protein